MSEKEIIIDAKQFINNIKEILNEGNNDLTKKAEEGFYTLQVVLQGLLDLYNKEKEKNKELEKDISKMYYEETIINILQDEFNLTRIEAKELLEE